MARCADELSRFPHAQAARVDQSPKAVAPSSFSANLPRGAELDNIQFTGKVHETDFFFHHNRDEQETWRIGEPGKLAWRWSEDLVSSSGGWVEYYTDDNGQVRTIGAFWSRVLRWYELPAGASPHASARDGFYNQNLRDHYTYVETPSYRIVLPGLPVPARPCKFRSCYPGVGPRRLAADPRGSQRS